MKKEYFERYREKNRELLREKQRIYREKHRGELRKKQREYYKKNKEKINSDPRNKKAHSNWIKKNPEKNRMYAHRRRLREQGKMPFDRKSNPKEYDKIQREKHKDARREYDRKYYEKNKERVLGRNKNWNSTHLKERNIHWQNYNARIKFNGGSLTASQIKELRKESQGICKGYKREPHFVDEENLTIDHIIPLIKGGRNSIENIQLLCKSCNSKKGVE